ncbi:DUF349 domain-containing protein [Cellulomonas telluris]|uniref:DUF349 domain-containing protein n=1 Tax=Cellulomonas telluris TaxID=2306636 RepID=UPI001FE2F9F9|nr:DUF349 domain-containing protein [Cellulomonas telluris]
MTEHTTTPSADDADRAPALTETAAAADPATADDRPSADDAVVEDLTAAPSAAEDAAVQEDAADEPTPADGPADEPVAPEATADATPTQDAPVAEAVEETPEIEAATVEETPETEPATVEETPETEPATVEETPETEPATVEETPETEPATVEETPASEVATAGPEGTDEPAEEAQDGATAQTGTDAATETAPAAPLPGGRPGPRPTPGSVRPGPRPTPRAATAAPAAPAAVAPVAPPVDPAEAARAAEFGRVDEDGTVHVREAAGERVVGQFPGASTEEALGLYVRRYLDLQAKVALFEARLSATDLSVKEIDQTLAKLTQELAEPAAVGDLDGLRGRLEGLRERAAERRAQAEAERQAAREAAVAARTRIVEQAEKIATTDPARIQWRPAGEQLRALLEEWKEAQRQGPRIDRPTEESLWKRFSHARTTFDRERRHFFAELESRNAEAKATKESLVAQAEALSGSTDWGATSAAFRDLMARWKAAGRANRQVDDALWARFRAAQDAFFSARDAANQAVDAEFRANLEVKEALLVEAEALVPVRDIGGAKSALRSIQDRWEAAGKVPRADVQRVEGRLRAVEQAVRDAENAQWRRANPETRARAEGAAAQLEQAIASLEADLAAAEAAGDKRRVQEARAALDARRAWLEQVQRAAHDARG